MTALLETKERADAQRRSRRVMAAVGAAAAAAAIVVGAVVLTDSDRSSQEPTEPQPTVSTSPEAVALGFVDAFWAFDAEQASSYLSPDTTTSPTDLAANIAWYEAAGFQTVERRCNVTTLPEVICRFSFHGLGSDQLGLGPYPGLWFTLDVRDGKVESAQRVWAEAEAFGEQMWRPFRRWLDATHPQDANVMYVSEFDPSVTAESTALWAQRVPEYLAR